ncbi:MAG: four helix bundle protein [Parcubacteria group bacterium]|nr:four helix bundle protein [Parcubacteria group bacterium]
MQQETNKKGYKNLIVWQKSDELAFQVYLATKKFPKEEMFGLISQMRRAAVSVPANIVEGYARYWQKEKIQFYNIARGSLSELEYYLDFSFRLGYLTKENYLNLVKLRNETGRLLHGFVLSVKK